MIGKLDSFLTPVRQQLIADAVARTNQHIRNLLKEAGHIFQRKPTLLKAQNIRGWLVAYVDEYLSADEGILLRSPQNIDGLQIDGKYFLHFKKLPSPDVCPEETPTLRKARLESLLQQSIFSETSEEPECQLPLFELEENTPPIRELPLCELEHYTLGYSTSDEYLINRVFVLAIDYTNEQIVEYVEIALAPAGDVQELASSPSTPPDVAARGGFVVKKKDIEEGRTA